MTWWPFLAIAVPLVLTPGASTAVVLRSSLAGGTRAGLEAAAGANAASICLGLCCGFGFAVALARWPSVWMTLRVVGVVYLALLGVQSLVRAWRRSSAGSASKNGAFNSRPDDISRTSATSSLTYLRNGFVTNVTNPALATFYFIVVPQFVPTNAPIMASVLSLTAVHVALAFSWHAVWAAAGGTLARVLGAGRPRRILEAATGVAMIGLAIRLALR